jgi:tRNA-Thr(GGU) m(6)t(6)A37 methyltransferase TsaA
MGPHWKLVGTIRSCYRGRFGVPRQPGLVKKALAFIEVSREWQPELSLQGLDRFSHLWVLFFFHENKVSSFHAKVHPPRLRGESIGLFATRSPHRPNPIGMSVVEIIKITDTGVWVRGGDFVDGSPVLDIKPYIPEVEAISHAKMEWIRDQEPGRTLSVDWSPEAQIELKNWQNEYPQLELAELIEETLKLDPRPEVYKAQFGLRAFKDIHAVRIYDGDVHFSFSESSSGTTVTVIKILREEKTTGNFFHSFSE